jgi:uncharacterized protein YutE (UPF0331/DUF86 family)
MTRKEIETKKRELTEILKENDAGVRLEKLQRLAKEVGASVTRMEKVQTGHDAAHLYYSFENVITESEIVHNIQVALQTETTVDMCKTAARNFIIALVASIIACLSMIAAWVAALWRH